MTAEDQLCFIILVTVYIDVGRRIVVFVVFCWVASDTVSSWFIYVCCR